MKKPIELKIYESICPEDIISDDDPRRESILAEMKVVLYGTKEEAVAVIEWWSCWNSPNALHGFIRAARNRLKKMKERHNEKTI